LAKISKFNYLRPNESSSEDNEYPKPEDFEKLLDYWIKDHLDLKLLEISGKGQKKVNKSFFPNIN
jgi:hypothetical protein